MIELGQQVRDKITGFEGIAIGRIDYLFGCEQYGIAPPARDGKIIETQWFDAGRIQVTGRGVLPEEVMSSSGNPGGVNRDCPR